MKRIILNFEKKGNKFKELIQEAFNKDILNFLVSMDTYTELEHIERIKLFTKYLDIPAHNFIADSKDKLKELLSNKKYSESIIGYFKKLTSKDDETEIIELSKTRQVDFIISLRRIGK